MQSKRIREKFLQFFIQKGHQHQPAVPIVNKDDPSLLFVNAGMNPFKDIILANQPITVPRVVTVQPCLRVSGKHNDLEEVGVDTYHHTFFEMLGNWSFGDYFKEEAIAWAWELLTGVYQLPKERIYVTIFGGDQQDGLPKDHEAAVIWAKYLPATHILSFSREDNFWEMGEQGPCGPCSEIHLDIRSDAQRKRLPAAQLVNKGYPQVIEIWNLVFMQYNRQASGKLVGLPHKYIDTGMGFERLAMVLQGKTSNYDTDIFTPLIAKIEQISGKAYHQSETIAIAMRIIADHLRAVAFSIADGQAPAHAKAGYVIRRIVRRAIRYGYSHLSIQTPFIYQLVPVLGAQMEGIYPNLTTQQHYIEQLIQAEETAFLKTLATGLQLFNHLDSGKIHQGVIEGRVAFELYDTYGFPLDLTLLMAKEQGLTVDQAGFQEALQEQKRRSQKDAAIQQGDWQVVTTAVQPRFVGYDQLVVTTFIVQWRTITNKQSVVYQLVLAATPFYPEGGGQVADEGVILSGHQSIAVVDVQKEHGLIVHTVDQLPAQLEAPVEARVDFTKRTLAAGNHTATHLLQAALKQVIGAHVVQKGSLVTPALLRFDFAHPTKLSTTQLEAVEAILNQKIRENIACVEQRAVSLEAAKAMGAQALFGEKYGAEVRVITFDPAYSIELCGGTHLPFTGQIGFFKIIHETAIGSGIRRIEALTAGHAYHFVTQQSAALTTIADLLKHPKDLIQVVEKLIHEKKQLQKQVIAYQDKAIQQVTQQLQQQLEQVDDVYLLIQVVQLPYLHALQQIAWHYKAQYQKIFIVLAATLEQQAHLMILVSDPLGPYNHAHKMMQSIAPLVGGKGGGQPCFATAKGNNPAGIPVALKAARRLFTMPHA
ncbi:alanine--tRNA ligase [Cardinium endosymbiont of Oedothorax gibbosus]|uniref:alanine--tRNA ligase n=1 Tax=Cardinium endosymbiont of Oedothorax gibbosus TaxID=931101 RepID=UPI0020249064|nr:alanine--tRNA ligase [Cardinium endosymbiont of Oedothorax gibbosus]CAH2560033.1 Alanine--tRNA ligase [Cardinium endosymbiont of Oedothorax gibbosus]